MLDTNILKDLLHQPGMSKLDKLLLCMAVDEKKPKAIKDIKEIAKSAGLHGAKTWNISAFLSGSKGKAIRTDKGWELTQEGKIRVSVLAGAAVSGFDPVIANNLRSHLAKIADPQTSEFLDEAIRCYESKLYRAAVVLTWVGAVSVLYNYVHANKLKEFNNEARRRDQKWKDAKSRDDLSRMKEHNFLQIAAAISVFGKNVKDELEGCLKFRNGCGHPNSLRIGESRVSAHIETLILNVFSVY